MNRIEVSRRQFIRGMTLAVGTGLITACTPSESPPVPRKVVPQGSIPIVKGSVLATPTATIDTIRREFTPTAFAPLQDEAIKRTVDQAQTDETIRLDNAFIGHIIRIPWEGKEKEAYITTLDVVDENKKPKTTAIFLSSRCIFDNFEQNNQLGNPVFPGIWRINRRVDNIVAQVVLSSDPVNPKAILNVKQLTQNGRATNCQEETAFDDLKKIPWKEMPEDVAQLIGWLAKQGLNGFRRGFQTPNQNILR